MKYFLDQEFHEGFHKPLFGRKRHFIDLISIGIVGEDGSEFYAISKDFDISAAWNNEWLRENVLKPLYEQEVLKDWNRNKYMPGYDGQYGAFTKPNFRRLINNIGRTNKEIMCDIILYLYRDVYKYWMDSTAEFISRGIQYGWGTDLNHEFYGYYADYDWVLFCSLFGRMIDLPFGFPMYCRDLKQMLDKRVEEYRDTGYGKWMDYNGPNSGNLVNHSFEDCLKRIKATSDYPKQTNEHHALADAHWNKELYNFIISL